jgi:nucleoside phosphorylase
MVWRFRPRLVAMVGIAAGARKHDQRVGDVLAADATFDHGAGKLHASNGAVRLSPNHDPISIHPVLRTRLNDWAHERERVEDIGQRWPGARPSTPTRLYVGPLGSGAAVVAAQETVDTLLEDWRKLIGIDLEAHGAHLACQETVNPPPMFLCIKAISDFADGAKNEDWTEFAAFMAAELCHRFLSEEWEAMFPLSDKVLGTQ